MTPGLAVAGSIALLLSLAAPLPLIPLLLRLGAHDEANDRSSHSGRALRGLGLGVLAAFVVAMCVGLLLTDDIDLGIVVVVIAAAAAISLLGLVEDVWGAGVLTRFTGQAALGVLIGVALVVVAGLPVWAVPLTALWFAAYVNFVNFMDGVDGISAGHGLVVGVAFTIAGSLWLEPWLSLAGLVIAASFVGFLPWNLLRRGTFLGDTGSYLLGGSIAVAVVAGIARGVPAVVLIAPLAIYLVDTVFTVLRRMARAEPWLAAHRSHTYQLLTQRGLSHVASSAIVSAASALCAVAGLGGGILGPSWHGAAWLVIAALAIAYLAAPRMLGTAPPEATKLAPPPSPLPARARIAERGRAVVVGASGFVGSHVVRRLGDDGWETVALTAPRLSLSPGSNADDARGALHAHESTVLDLAAAFDGADVIVNAAGLAAPDAPSGEALFGANALLPAVLAAAAAHAGAGRFVHVSSAAVQGRRAVLDESAETEAFSPYSRSKALGERVLLQLVEQGDDASPEIVIVRATSVHGAGRPTTARLRRIAASPLSSVAAPGDHPSVVSSIDGLSEFVSLIARFPSDVPTIVLQPWEGLATSDVLRNAGDRRPRRIPASAARALIALGYLASAVLPRFRGPTRRLEVMWFGQAQDASWSKSMGLDGGGRAADVLRGAS